MKVVIEWYSPYAMAQYRSKSSYRQSLEFKCLDADGHRWSIEGSVPNTCEEILALSKFGYLVSNPEKYELTAENIMYAVSGSCGNTPFVEGKQ